MLAVLLPLAFGNQLIGGCVGAGDEEQGVAVVPRSAHEVLKGNSYLLLLHDVSHGLAPVLASVGLVLQAAQPFADVREVSHAIALLNLASPVLLLGLFPRNVVAGREHLVVGEHGLVRGLLGVLVPGVVHERDRLGLERAERAAAQLVQPVEVSLENLVRVLDPVRAVDEFLFDVAASAA